MLNIIFKEGQGLGNQLWLFAVAKSICEKLNQNLIIEDFHNFKGTNFLNLEYNPPVDKKVIYEKKSADNFKVFSEKIYYDYELKYVVSSFDENILNIEGDTICKNTFTCKPIFLPHAYWAIFSTIFVKNFL